MKISRMRVNWQLGWDHDPKLEVLLSGVTPWEERRWNRAPDGRHWWTDAEGLVTFYFWNPGSNNGGLCGRSVSITMEGGQQVDLLGPWCGCPDQVPDDRFPHVIEVTWTDKPADYESGRLCYGGYLRVDFVRAALKDFPNLRGIRIVNSADYEAPEFKAQWTPEEYAKRWRYCPTYSNRSPDSSKAAVLRDFWRREPNSPLNYLPQNEAPTKPY